MRKAMVFEKTRRPEINTLPARFPGRNGAEDGKVMEGSRKGLISNNRFDSAIRVEHRTYGLKLQAAPPEQPDTVLPPSDLPNGPSSRHGWCGDMRRKHHRRYQRRFCHLANLAGSLTAPAAAGLLLALVALLAITQAQGNGQLEPCSGGGYDPVPVPVNDKEWKRL